MTNPDVSTTEEPLDERLDRETETAILGVLLQAYHAGQDNVWSDQVEATCASALFYLRRRIRHLVNEGYESGARSPVPE